MMIDAHHHLWEYNQREYTWMDNSMEILKTDYLPADLEAEMAISGVTGTVAVQARQSLEETRWLLMLADQHTFVRGVVGWVDLQSDHLANRLTEFAGHSRLVGVRHVIHDEPDDEFMLRPAFVRGIRMLADFGLTYDLLLFPKHLKPAIKLAGMCPGQKFVLDHMAKPFIDTRILHPWKEELKELSSFPNVWCKISGMVTEADRRGWRYEDFVPYMEVVMEAFGPDRVMLGSDWPVCRLAASYKDVMEIPGRFFRDFDMDVREKIFSRNAVSFYGLK